MKRFALVLILPLISACSLKYGTNYLDDEAIPEFVFTDANFNKYEDNKKTMALSAERLEQYSGGNDMFAQNVTFSVINSEGKVTTEGSCGLLSANSKEEKYTLYDDIQIHNTDDGITVFAKSLKWNGKSEQLTSSRNDTVRIKKGGTELIGSGFSASAVSKKFVFSGATSGSYNSEESENAAEEAQSEAQNE